MIFYLVRVLFKKFKNIYFGLCWSFIAVDGLPLVAVRGVYSLVEACGLLIVGLPRWLSGKESACHCRRCGFNPWVGKIP